LIEPAGVCFARLQELEPREPRWPHLRGETLMLHNRAEEAIAPLEQAAALGDRQQPPAFAPRLRLAEAFLAAARPADAEIQFLRAKELEPDHPNVHLGLAQVALARNDDKAAEPLLLRCVDSPTTRQRASALLAGICLRGAEPERAAEFNRRATALPIDAGWGDPWVQECFRYAIGKSTRYRTLDNAANQGRNREAIELAREYLQAGPDASILVTLGRCQINLGDYAGAEQSLRDALKLTPDHVQPNYLLSKAVCAQAEILWQQDADKTSALSRFHEAANLAQKAIAAQGDHAMAHLIFGICRLRQGQRTDGVAALRMAMACAPEHPEPALYLGIALTEDGQFAEARRLLEFGQRLAPPEEPRFAAALQKLNERKK
jgi:tetratricopeptide (TPR) repeat protein